MESLDTGSNQVQALTTPQLLQDATTPVLEVGEQLTGLTSLADGTLVLAITPVSTSKKGDNPTRLTFLGTPSKTLTVSGLKKQEALESLLLTNDGSLLGLVVKKNASPPVRLVDINPQTGEISSKDKVILPGNQQFSNLAQCPDGKIYTTSVERDGSTNLVQLDLAQKKPITQAQLRFNNTVWIGGLNSLVCSPEGQLFAFGARWHESPKYLHTVDVSTGVMTRLRAFDVAKVTFARA